MKNNIYSILIISLFATLLIVSCSKTITVDPASQTCYLASTSNAKGNVLEKLTYDANNRLISETSDSSGLTYSFAYNAQSLMDKITIAVKTPTSVLNVVTLFTYDASNKATKAVTTLNGSVYQTNVFTYVGTQLSQIVSTDFQ